LKILCFFENSIIPHRDREEAYVFPIILNLKTEEKPLIEELIDEHKKHLNEFKHLKEDLAKGKLTEAKKQIEKLLNGLKKHIEREEPLYQSLLKEALKN
jgi:iron-sulfur cluster repair protein YtfE (RIC family)